jgi:hypothetical protein
MAHVAAQYWRSGMMVPGALWSDVLMKLGMALGKAPKPLTGHPDTPQGTVLLYALVPVDIDRLMSNSVGYCDA